MFVFLGILSVLVEVGVHAQAEYDGTFVVTSDGRRAFRGIPVDPPTAPQAPADRFGGDDIIGSSQHNRALGDEAYRWPNGIMHFEYDSALPPAQRKAFEEAAADFAKYTCLRVLPRNGDAAILDYVKVVNGKGCKSALGRRTGMQELSLGEGCQFKATAIHELMHAFGWEHEQSRLDRDDFITLNKQNIMKGYEDQFTKADGIEDSDISKILLLPATPGGGMQQTPQIVQQVNTYCYGSVMQYARNIFSIREDLTTMDPKTTSPVEMGQRRGFADCDILRIRAYYQCDAANQKSLAPLVKFKCDDGKIEDGQVTIKDSVQVRCKADGRGWKLEQMACVTPTKDVVEFGKSLTVGPSTYTCTKTDKGATLSTSTRVMVPPSGGQPQGQPVGPPPAGQELPTCKGQDGKPYPNGQTWREGSYKLQCRITQAAGGYTIASEIAACFAEDNTEVPLTNQWFKATMPGQPAFAIAYECTKTANGASFGQVGCAINRKVVPYGVCQIINPQLGVTCTQTNTGISISTAKGNNPCGGIGAAPAPQPAAGGGGWLRNPFGRRRR